MGEDDRPEGSHLSSRQWGHAEHIAALILQRAFLRSRVRRAHSERIRAEDIARRLVQADTDLVRCSASWRWCQQRKVQLSVQSGGSSRTLLRSSGSSKPWAPFLMRAPRRSSLKRVSGAAAGHHLAALQIIRRLRTVAGQQEQDEEDTEAETPSTAGIPPSPLPRSRFSRASAVHQLTPYRPRRSGSGLQTPPSVLAAAVSNPNQTPLRNSRDVSVASGDEGGCLNSQLGSTPLRSLVVSCAAERRQDPTLPQTPDIAEVEEERWTPGPVPAVRLSAAAVENEAAEELTIRLRCLSAPAAPFSDVGSDEASDVAAAPCPVSIAACMPPVTHPPPTQDCSLPPPSNTPLGEQGGQSRPAVGLSSMPAGEAPVVGTPLVKCGSESRLSLGLSPFPGGTPPLPSKLAAKAAEEMGQWREEVQHMRKELSRSYKSICHLQSVLWESPTARRLLSPATLRRKRSPHRSLGLAKKLPPSPLSRMSLPDTPSQTQPRPSSAANGGLATGVFYLGGTHSGKSIRTIPKPTGGAVAFGRKLNAAGASAQGSANRERGDRQSECESGSETDVPNGRGRGVSNQGSVDHEDVGASIRGSCGRSVRDLDASRTLPGVASSSGGEPSTHHRIPRGQDGSRAGSTGRGNGAAAGVESAPSGILGFLHGLFSPVSGVNTGLETTGPSGGSREQAGTGASASAVDEWREGVAHWATADAKGVSTAEPDTWHDASDEVLPRSILFEHSPNHASRSSSPRHQESPEPSHSRTSVVQSSPAGRRATTPVRSPALSIQAVVLPPLTSSYSTTPAALALPPPLLFSPPTAGHENSPRRNRILVHRSHNESEIPVLQKKSEGWSAPAPPTPFHPESENVPRNKGAPEQPKSRTKSATAASSVNDRGLLSSFYRSAGAGSRPLPPVTRDVLQQKVNSGKKPGGSAQSENAHRSVESTPQGLQANGDSVLGEGRRVKWWDAEEEEDKENGIGVKKPKDRSPRYSPKHMSATPSKSILKQGVHVGFRSLAQARDLRLRKLQAQAALGPKLSGRALRIKGRYI